MGIETAKQLLLVQDKIQELSATESAAGEIEKAAYSVAQKAITGEISADWKVFQDARGRISVLAPKIMLEEVRPEAYEYIQRQVEERQEIVETIPIWVELLRKGWSGNSAAFDQYWENFTIPPILLLNVSCENQTETEHLLNIQPGAIKRAFNQTSYWKASEILEWISVYQPSHDIWSYYKDLADDLKPMYGTESFFAAFRHLTRHEMFHPFVDTLSIKSGYGTHNWLTEGACEFFGGERGMLQLHANSVLPDLSVNRWTELVELSQDPTFEPKKSKYSIGSLIVLSASRALEPKNPIIGFGKFLSGISTEKLVDLNSGLKSVLSKNYLDEQRMNEAFNQEILLLTQL